MKQPTPIWRGKVQHGKIQLERRADFAALKMRLEGQEIELVLRKFRRQRSLSQNSYLWGVVYAIFGEYLGYTDEETHSACKQEFLRDRAHEINGLAKIRSTTRLDTAEMAEYIENIRRLAAEMPGGGVYIPSPNEVGL